MTQPESNGPTPERLMQFAWGYAAPIIISTAVNLGVFDQLDRGPGTAAEVAAAIEGTERGARGVLNALVGLGLLSKTGDRYALTPESATFLVSHKPGYYGTFFGHMTGQLIPKWLQLDDVVRTGNPAMSVNSEGNGTEFFEKFVESLFPISYRAAQTVAANLRLAEAGAASVLDLAAGSGVWGIALAQAGPAIRVTAVDWPGVLVVTKRVAGRFGLEDRFTFSPGDLHEADFGSGHRVATLGHILHSEGEERSKALLCKTFAALASGGTIAIAEFVPNDERTGPPHTLFFAVNMLVNTDAGDAFTFAEISAWLKEAGFVNVRQLEAPAPSPLILADKP